MLRMSVILGMLRVDRAGIGAADVGLRPGDPSGLALAINAQVRGWTTGSSIAPSCIPWLSASTSTWSDGLCGNSNDYEGNVDGHGVG
jgi:hypothetical protein